MLVAYHSDPQLHSAEYRRFKDAVRAAAVHTSSNQPDGGVARDDVTAEGQAAGSCAIVDPVSIHRAARAIGGGLKPWGEIFDRLLSGNIPFAITGDRVRRIMISKHDAVSLCATDLTSVTPSSLPPTCSQRDALEILNLPGKHAELLKTLADADDDWEMPWSAVLDLARTRITLAELCARTGINATILENLMEDIGCPRMDRFGWLRRSALPKLQQTISLKGREQRKKLFKRFTAFELPPRRTEVQGEDHHRRGAEDVPKAERLHWQRRRPLAPQVRLSGNSERLKGQCQGEWCPSKAEDGHSEHWTISISRR
ncbi:hypothetical protein ACVOMT_09530 [Sphingomonas panni]